ncbi:PepSY domain-containing protein [Micromonospora sp. KLBMP9576]|uniref:PepSY domain-containing protein n=1 Tax=Micromonospora sp. KLBMP9576 TaxID=3424769 RepID=UPI003D912B0D
MKRNSLLLASVSGVAVLAATGLALGVAAADGSPPQATTLAAATTAPSAPATPGGTAPGTPAGSGTPTTGATTGAPGTPSGSGAPATGGDAVTEQRAREIALAKAGGGDVVEVEREDEDGRAVWSVEIVAGQTEHEVDVDRGDGSVVKAEQEPVDDDDDDDDDRNDDDDDDDDGDDD